MTVLEGVMLFVFLVGLVLGMTVLVAAVQGHRSVSAAGWLQLAALVFVVLADDALLGAYLARVLEGSVFAGGI